MVGELCERLGDEPPLFPFVEQLGGVGAAVGDLRQQIVDPGHRQPVSTLIAHPGAGAVACGLSQPGQEACGAAQLAKVTPRGEKHILRDVLTRRVVADDRQRDRGDGALGLVDEPTERRRVSAPGGQHVGLELGGKCAGGVHRAPLWPAALVRNSISVA